MDRDGTEDGYELELTRRVADAVDVPVIASGGAGTLEHLVEAVSGGRRRRRAVRVDLPLRPPHGAGGQGAHARSGNPGSAVGSSRCSGGLGWSRRSPRPVVFAGAASADDFERRLRGLPARQPDHAMHVHDQAQLQNAKQQAESFGDAVYGGFIGEVDHEIARWDSGGCTGVAAPPPERHRAPRPTSSRCTPTGLDGGTLTRCGHRRASGSSSALSEANKVPNFDAYVPGFRNAVRAQLRAINDGRCAAVLPGALRIVRIQGEGRVPRPARRVRDDQERREG